MLQTNLLIVPQNTQALFYCGYVRVMFMSLMVCVIEKGLA